jgi:ParB-like chromosome segregation protein Spo0J
MTTTIEPMAVARLRPSVCNARTHSKKQIRQIASSIARFGFTNPILIDGDDRVIAGHGRLEAAKLLGLQHVPTLRLSALDATQRRAYALADNKLALNSGWDRAALAVELRALAEVQFDAEVTGFSCAEIEVVLDTAAKTGAASAAKTQRRKESAPPDDAAVKEFGTSARKRAAPSGEAEILDGITPTHHRTRSGDAAQPRHLACVSVPGLPDWKHRPVCG